MVRLNDLTIKATLYGLVIVSTVALLIVLGLAAYLLATFGVTGPVYERLIRRNGAIGEMQPAVLFAQRPYWTLGQLLDATDPAEIRELRERFRELEAAYHSRHDYWVKELGEGPTKQGLTGPVHRTAVEFFKAANREFLPLLDKGDRKAAAQVYAARVKPRFDEHSQAVAHTVEAALQKTAEEEKEVRDRVRLWETLMLVIGIGTAVLSATLGWFVTRGVVRSTGKLIRRVNEMASGAGDLTARVALDSHDEMGKLAEGMNAMVAKIQAVVARVRESSIQLLSTASEIAATARQQDTTVQGLSSATAQVAAAVREISATSKELAGTMNEVNERASQAASLATTGRSHLAGMEGTMQQLVESTASISAKLAL